MNPTADTTFEASFGSSPSFVTHALPKHAATDGVVTWTVAVTAPACGGEGVSVTAAVNSVDGNCGAGATDTPAGESNTLIITTSGCSPPGASCQAGASCATGNCVDGVCCSSPSCGVCGTCGSGQCAPKQAGQPCGNAPAGDCDAQDVCNGVDADACPDEKYGADHVCRPSEGLCDAEERCDGTSSACGPNVFKLGQPCTGVPGQCSSVCKDGLAVCPGDGDADCDGLPDPWKVGVPPGASDHCPCDMTNADADSPPDGACDKCDPELGAECAAWCASHPVDNCIGVSNLQAQNGNAESEDAHDAVPLGDACVPVPQPLVSVGYTASVAPGGPVPPIGPAAWACTEVFEQTELSSVTLRPVGSYSSPSVFGALGGKPGAMLEDPAVVTDYRVCFESVSNCSLPTSVRDAFADPGLLRADENEFGTWYRIRLDSPASDPLPQVIFPDSQDKLKNYGFDGKKCTRVWRWRTNGDFDYWLAPGRWGEQLGFARPTTASGKDHDLRIWAHARTEVGTTVYADTGRHPRRSDTSQVAGQLANHYIDATFLTSETVVACRRTVPATPIPWYVHRPWESVKPPPFRPPQPDPLYDGSSFSLAHAAQRVRLRSEVIMTIGSGYDQRHTFGRLRDDGRLEPMGDKLSAGLAQKSIEGMVLLGSVEADALAGGDAPLAIGLSADGTAIIERVTFSGRGLIGESEQGCIGERCTFPVPRSASSRGGGLASSPPARQGFSAAYAKSLGQVVVAGGHDTRGRATGDIWRVSVDNGEWEQIRTAFRPDNVLSVTTSFVDRMIWVLDEVKTGGLRRARLTRVNPITGHHVVFATWPRLGLSDQAWLSLDAEGSLLLTTSSTLLRRHAVVRIDIDGTPRPERLAWGNGALAFAPIVDASGYTFAKSQGGRDMPKLEHRDELGGSYAEWHQLGGCF